MRTRRRLRETYSSFAAGEARLLVRLLGVGPHHPRPGQVLLDERVHLRELRLHLLEAVVDLAAVVAHQPGDEDEGHEGEEGEPRARSRP